MGLFTKKSQYQKDCEAKIEELCGGFFFNENYEKRVRKFNRTTQSIPHDRVKGVLKHECEDGKLALEDIETRLDELMQLDCNTLDLKIRMTNKQDTSIFKTQDDIVKYMGPEYEAEYSWKIEQRKIKTREKIIEKEGHFDFNDGVSVNLVTSEFGLKVNNSTGENIFQTTGIASEKDSERNLFLTTFMQVTDSKIIFQKALEDGGDLEIPFSSIESIERVEDDYIKIRLKEYQKVLIKFTGGSGFSKKEINQYLEDEFFRLVKIDENQSLESSSGTDELFRLVEMYEKGYLTKEEFEAQKLKIISSNTDTSSSEEEISSKVCPECRTPLSESDTFCPVCGRSI